MKQVNCRHLIAVALLATCTGTFARAQEVPASQMGALRVFLDCQYFCDFDHLRREITFVNWVRDRSDAQVHILVTTQRTGGGGTEYTMAFIGLEDFTGREDTLQYVSQATDVQDQTRNGIARTLSLGLVRYAAQLPVSVDLRVVHAVAQEERSHVAATAEDDPWNFWVFSTRIGSYMNGQSSLRSFSGNGSLTASRTTEGLRVSLSASGNWDRDEYELSDDETVVTTSRSLNFRSLMAWSIGDHWSIGGEGSLSNSTYYNRDLSVTVTPAIEYDIFPYTESSRRMLTLKYAAGIQSFNFEEETIFGRMSEVRPIHDLSISLDVTQPWGTINTSLRGFQFLHDLSRHRVDLFGSLNIRIVKGLSFNTFLSVSRVKDQIYLAAGEATDEEILLRVRQLGTDYQYYANFGLRYTFGSIFNNIVNPRFGGGGGGMMIMY